MATYTDLPYNGCGLMIAENPWSGHYDVSSPMWITAHTTQFTKPGWIYLQHGNGTGLLPSGGSYVTLVPPNNSEGDFSIIVETMSHDNSVCIRPNLPPYNVSPQTVTFTLEGGLATTKVLYVWYTHLNQNQSNIYFENIMQITPENGQFTLNLDVDSVFTISTLTGQQKGSYAQPPPSTAFPSLYTDNFDSYPISSEANYFQDQTGVWEIYPGDFTNKIMRQQVVTPPLLWCSESNRPISLIGDSSATDAQLSVDVLIEDQGSVNVGVRVQSGGCSDSYASGYFFSIDQNGNWNLLWSFDSSINLQNDVLSFN